MKKILFISSTGGHFSELMKLEPLFKNYNYSIITEKDKATRSLSNKYKGKVFFFHTVREANSLSMFLYTRM